MVLEIPQTEIKILGIRPNFKNFYEECHEEKAFSGEEGKEAVGITASDGKKLLLRSGKNPTEQDAGPAITATHCLSQVLKKGRATAPECLCQVPHSNSSGYFLLLDLEESQSSSNLLR